MDSACPQQQQQQQQQQQRHTHSNCMIYYNSIHSLMHASLLCAQMNVGCVCTMYMHVSIGRVLWLSVGLYSMTVCECYMFYACRPVYVCVEVRKCPSTLYGYTCNTMWCTCTYVCLWWSSLALKPSPIVVVFYQYFVFKRYPRKWDLNIYLKKQTIFYAIEDIGLLQWQNLKAIIYMRGVLYGLDFKT